MKIFNILGQKYFVAGDVLVLSMPPNNHIALFTTQDDLDSYSVGNKFLPSAIVLNAIRPPQITTGVKPIIYTEEELAAYRLWAFNTGIFPDRPLYKTTDKSTYIGKKEKVNINDDMGVSPLSSKEEEELFLEEPKFTIKELLGYLPDAKNKQLTGFNSLAEWFAYQKGREDEEKVLIEFIEKWAGSTNSKMGQLLNIKCKNMAAKAALS